jgi:hypothetical protein
MNRIALFCLLLLAVSIAAHTQPAQKIVRLKRGQTLSLEYMTSLDSAHVNVGDDVPLRLTRPLVADGAVILPLDSVVHGKVTRVMRAGICKSGEIAWTLHSIETPNGEYIRVQEVVSYPFKYFRTDGDPEWVPLGTPLTPISGGVKYAGTLAVAVALSPFLVPMVTVMAIDDWRNGCKNEPGSERILPAGLGDLYAVSKSQRVTAMQ